MKQLSGFLLVELSLALILTALSVALITPLITQILFPHDQNYTTLLKAHYDIAHALRRTTPFKKIEASPEKITLTGATDEIVMISYAHGGCSLTKEGTTTALIPRSCRSSIHLKKQSHSCMSLTITFSEGETSLTLIHPIYIV